VVGSGIFPATLSWSSSVQHPPDFSRVTASLIVAIIMRRAFHLSITFCSGRRIYPTPPDIPQALAVGRVNAGRVVEPRGGRATRANSSP
jgi:hypothetical protein